MLPKFVIGTPAGREIIPFIPIGELVGSRGLSCDPKGDKVVGIDGDTLPIHLCQMILVEVVDNSIESAWRRFIVRFAFLPTS